MSDEPIPDLPALPLALADRVDRACDTFEANWRAGRRQPIESLLADATGPERAALLRELLALELELRRTTGERPEPWEYHQQFPADAGLIDAAFGVVPIPETVAESVPLTPPSSHRWRPVSEDDETALPVPDVAGYEILDELGRGGMGVVYKARHRLLNRIVALKMIRAGTHAQPDHRARFRIEAEAVARLRHPNIVQIYDIGEPDGRPFFSLELLEGGSLADRLKGTPQPGRAAAALVATLARAMHAAHQAGIVHRDLKPANVLFDRDGVPKITDFGLAKRLDVERGPHPDRPGHGHAQLHGPRAGPGTSPARSARPPTSTPWAPSSTRCSPAGRRSRARTSLETLRQVVYDEPVPPSRLQPRVPRDLETICLKCLQKEPQKRYASAQELADDLGRYLAGGRSTPAGRPCWERGREVGPAPTGGGHSPGARPGVDRDVGRVLAAA